MSLTFYNSLDPKMQWKLGLELLMPEQLPQAFLREPHVKHFQLERYSRLYELRAKSGTKIIRLIDTNWRDGKILLLFPFYKTQPRDTEKAFRNNLLQY